MLRGREELINNFGLEPLIYL